MSIVLPEVEKSFFELKEVKKQFALYVRDYRMAAIPANSRNGGSWLRLLKKSLWPEIR